MGELSERPGVLKSMNRPCGAGSQLASVSPPGDWCGFAAMPTCVPVARVWVGGRNLRVRSIAFTVTVIANFVALAPGTGMPPPWVTYSPLLPLALLLLTGLYVFVLPYATKWRSGSAPRRTSPHIGG